MASTEPVFAPKGCRRLNLGCGQRRLDGAVNLDCVATTDPDVVWDLNVRPWPFETGSFNEVLAYDVIEHLDDFVGCMTEVHRVCDSRAIVRITVPHFSSWNAFSDPTHKRFFGMKSFDVLTDASQLAFYSTVRFRIVHRHLVFLPGIVNRVVARVANRVPERYERRWAWIFPAWFIYIELEVE